MVQYAFIVSAMVPLRTIAIHDPMVCVTTPLQALRRRFSFDHPFEVWTSESHLREVTTNVCQFGLLAGHLGARRGRLAGGQSTKLSGIQSESPWRRRIRGWRRRHMWRTPPQSLRMLPVFWLESLETEDPRVGADTRVVAEAHVEDPPSVHDTRPVSTMSSPVVVEE